jgi:hypothetical protein
MRYSLSEKEACLAFKVANARMSKARENNIFENKKSKKHSSFFIDYNGAAGEIAFLGLMLSEKIISNIEYDKNLKLITSSQIKSAFKGKDDGDLVIKNINIDVKTSVYSSAHLWITENKKYTSLIDGYVLMTGNVEKSYNFFYKGYLSHSFVLKNWNNTTSKTSGKFSQKDLTNLPF